jgi:peptidoglycan hydrolase-like protein with peptidoglycan-binding domain
MDTRYYQQYENYIADLVSGRLPIQAEHRQNVQPLPVADDGTFRLGESDPRISDLQRVMTNEGYRAAEGRPLDQDGVYRPSMQGALLDFQRAHGIPQTGDIDPATLRFVPSLEAQLGPPPVDCELPGRRGLPGHVWPPGPTAPGHPDHPDHQPGLPDPLPAPVNQRALGQQAEQQPGPFNDPLLNQAYAAALRDDDAELGRIAREFSLASEGQQMTQLGRELFAQQQQQEQQVAQNQSRGRSM